MVFQPATRHTLQRLIDVAMPQVSLDTGQEEQKSLACLGKGMDHALGKIDCLSHH